MKVQFTTLCATMAMFCTGSLLSADEVSIEIKSTGATWRGDTADTVKVGFRNNGVPIELRAKIDRIEDLYIVVRELETNRKWTIFRADLTSIETVSGDATGGTDNAGENVTNAAHDIDSARRSTTADAYDDKTPGVFVLPLTGEVGATFRHDEIEALAVEADKYGPGQIIVLDINSPGGLTLEMVTIYETLKEVKKRHRVVAWIHDAISAAAATAINCDEIYFRTEGTLGAITAHAAGQGIGDELQQENLINVRRMMVLGGRPEFIADAMVLANAEVSYDVDPITEEVKWYPNTSGEFVLSKKGQNLVFTSSEAMHSKFADGIADTQEELASLLGLSGWHEKSPFGHDLAEDVTKIYERGQKEVPLLVARLSFAGAAGGTISVLQKRIQTLQQLMRWWDLHMMLCLENGVPPKETLQQLIDETREQIRRLRG